MKHRIIIEVDGNLTESEIMKSANAMVDNFVASGGTGYRRITSIFARFLQNNCFPTCLLIRFSVSLSKLGNNSILVRKGV